jgi:hypothetical protein
MLVFFMAILSILRLNCIYYGHLVQFVAIWYIFPISVCCTDKNLATLITRCLSVHCHFKVHRFAFIYTGVRSDFQRIWSHRVEWIAHLKYSSSQMNLLIRHLRPRTTSPDKSPPWNVNVFASIRLCRITRISNIFERLASIFLHRKIESIHFVQGH